MARWASLELVSAALTGDDVAAERLVTAVWPGCFRLAATVMGDLTVAQDVAQEACVIVLRKVRTLRDPEAFDSWLYRVVMRESARARRRNGESHQALLEEPLGIFDPTMLDVWKALADLPSDLRDVTVLFYFDEFTSAEIAVILGVAHSTVRTRLSRARDRLRGLLDDYKDGAQSAPDEVTQHAF